MKALLVFLVVGMMFATIEGQAQNLESLIGEMFSTKDAVDFNLVSQSGGGSYPCKYYVAKDTLYDVPTRKIALCDIDFQKTEIWKNVFNFINGVEPYVLTLRPKAGAKTLYMGSPSTGTIDIYCPSETFAHQTRAWLIKRTQNGNEAAAAPSTGAELPEPATLCKAIATFTNDLLTTNLANYLGSYLSADMGFSLYDSKIKFPHAIETIIADTSALRPDYRKAKILVTSETRNDDKLSETMLAWYAHYNYVFNKCLDKNGFTIKNNDGQVVDPYKMQTEYTRLLSEPSKDPFANLQAQRALIIHVSVQQSKLPNGSFSNKLYVYIDAQ